MVLDFLTSIIQGIFTVFLKTWWIIVPILGALAWQNLRKASWVQSHDSVLLSIKIPRSNDKDPTAAEMLFATLHGILKPKKELIKEGSYQEHISFEIVATIDAIQFYVWTPTHLKDFVEGQVYAQYPSAEIKVAEDYSLDTDINDDGIDDFAVGTEIKLAKNEILPIKTFQNFKVDPLAGITGVLSKLEKSDEKIWIQILARPVPDQWQNQGLNYIKAKKTGSVTLDTGNIGNFLLSAPFRLISEIMRPATAGAKKEAPKLSSDEEVRLSAIEEKTTKLGYRVKIRTVYISRSKELAKQRLQAVIGTFKQFNTTNLNGFTSGKEYIGKNFLDDYRARLFVDRGFILNIEELASLYHLPHTSVETPNIKWTSSKTGEPPTELPTEMNTAKEELTLFAETNFRHTRAKFGIKLDDRRRHTYIIGKSGMGKSKLLENFIEEDIQRGNGLAVIDPNGDLIHDTLKKIPAHRINDVILLDPADQEFPVGFNPLEVDNVELKHFIAQGFVGTLEKMFGHSWGPRLEYILNYTVLALLDYPESTVLGIVRMLTDKNFRKKVVSEIKDPVVKKFWTTEFATYNDKFASEAVAPILNKVGQFTASSLIRNMIGQVKSTFNFREAMDSKKIILINLSTGRVGEVNSALLGGMIITKLQLAAMSRADTKLEGRIDFFLYVDEFQHFATESFATILSEARKYRLNLTMANQYIAQMDEKVREAVFGNVGTLITFRIGAQDAGFLEKELNPPFESNDIINLDRQQIYLKMTIDGQTSAPFSAKTLTIPDIDRGNAEKLIQLSRERYGRPRKKVEESISKWAGMDEETFKDEENRKETKFEAPRANTFLPPLVRPFQKEIKNNKDQHKEAENKSSRERLQSLHHWNKEREHTPKEGRISEAEKPKHIEPIKEKVKKRVDKETLKEIIRNVVKTNNNKETKTGEGKPRENLSKENLNNQRIEKKAKETPEPKSVSFEREKEIKVVTPETFRELKEIHPHQKVEVRQHHDLKELKPGETVVFEKHHHTTDKS